jgi:hypothetical protein
MAISRRTALLARIAHPVSAADPVPRPSPRHPLPLQLSAQWHPDSVGARAHQDRVLRCLCADTTATPCRAVVAQQQFPVCGYGILAIRKGRACIRIGGRRTSELPTANCVCRPSQLSSTVFLTDATRVTEDNPYSPPRPPPGGLTRAAGLLRRPGPDRGGHPRDDPRGLQARAGTQAGRAAGAGP